MRGEAMLHHYITKYVDEGDGHLWCVAWLQADVFGRCLCFCERREDIGPAPEWHREEADERGDD